MFSEYETQYVRYRDARERLWNPIGAIPEQEFILPEPEPVEPEPEPQWVSILKRDAVRATLRSRHVFIGDCIKAVCTYYKISKLELISQRRHRSVVRPRQIAMYLSRKLTPHSLPEIGKRFGGRDHTTVLWAIRQITRFMEIDDQLCMDIEIIEQSIVGVG